MTFRFKELIEKYGTGWKAIPTIIAGWDQGQAAAQTVRDRIASLPGGKSSSKSRPEIRILAKNETSMVMHIALHVRICAELINQIFPIPSIEEPH